MVWALLVCFFGFCVEGGLGGYTRRLPPPKTSAAEDFVLNVVFLFVLEI